MSIVNKIVNKYCNFFFYRINYLTYICVWNTFLLFFILRFCNKVQEIYITEFLQFFPMYNL